MGPMGRDPGPMSSNGPGPGPNGTKWAGARAQWIQMGRDPGPNGQWAGTPAQIIKCHAAPK